MSTPAGTVTEEPTDQVAEDGTPQITVGDPGDDTAAGGTPPAPDAPDAGDADAINLLGREAFNSVKDDPKKLAKALNTAFTQKTQAIAKHRDFIEAFEADPKAALTRLAESFDLQVGDRPSKAATAAADIQAELAEIVGEDVAKGLLPILDKLTKSMIEREVGPTKQAAATLEAEAANREASALIERFAAKYPDWKKHEAKMEEIGNKIVPVPGMDDFEYIEMLYTLAKGKSEVATETGKVLTRMVASARSAERPAAGVPAARVADVPEGGKVSFDAAWEAAKRGVKWDADEIRRARSSAK